LARWDLYEYYDPDAEAHGTCYVKHGAFLEGAELIDHLFWGITPQEAQAMDPSHRIFMQVGYDAFVRAGYQKHALEGTSTGVVCGTFVQE
jgi:acyl transferase domain-containing protein